MRVLSVIRLMGMVEAIKVRVARQAQRLALALAFGGIGLLVALFGLFFVSVAAMLGLATVWPMHWAALTVGGVLLLIAAVLFYFASRPAEKIKLGVASPPPVERDPELLEAIHKAEALVRRHPAVATLGAIGLGLAVGFITGGKKSDGNR